MTLSEFQLHLNGTTPRLPPGERVLARLIGEADNAARAAFVADLARQLTHLTAVASTAGVSLEHLAEVSLAQPAGRR